MGETQVVGLYTGVNLKSARPSNMVRSEDEEIAAMPSSSQGGVVSEISKVESMKAVAVQAAMRHREAETRIMTR